MEHLDEILERLMNKPKNKQTNIFDQIEEQKDWKGILYDEIKDKKLSPSSKVSKGFSGRGAARATKRLSKASFKANLFDPGKQRTTGAGGSGIGPGGPPLLGARSARAAASASLRALAIL